MRISALSSHSLTTLFILPGESPNSISDGWLRSLVSKYRENDDVFQLEFLEGVIFVSEDSHGIEISPAAKSYLEIMGTKWIHCLSWKSYPGYNLKPGPYAFIDGHLREVWKLYSDTNGTLLSALKPDTEM